MAIVFSKAAGQIMSFPDPTLPANISLRLEGWGGFIGFKSVITRVTVRSQGNFQFLHTLGGLVFVYVFGDRIGDLTISGVAFDNSCYSRAGLLGIENVLNYYSANRMANRATPVKVTIGAATTLAGYMLNVTADVRDVKTRMWEFSITMGLIPADTDPGRSVTGFGSGSESGGSSSGSGGGTTSTSSGSGGEYTSPGSLPGPYDTHTTVSLGYAPVDTGPSVGLVRGIVTP